MQPIAAAAEGPLLAVRLPPPALPALRRFLEGAGGLPLALSPGPFEGFVLTALTAVVAEDRWLAGAAVSVADSGAAARLAALAVAAGQQGNGHGTRLLEAVADTLRARGVASLDASPTLPTAAGWLCRRGFAPGVGDAVMLLL